MGCQGGSIIFDYVQTKSKLQNFWGDHGAVSGVGGQSSFTMCTLNLNSKIYGKIMGSQWGDQSFFDHVQTKSKL